MTELINPRPVHDGRRSGSSAEGCCPSSRAAQFSKTTRRVRRVSSPPTRSRSAHKKGPSLEGPEKNGRGAAGQGSSLRGGSLRSPKQERPGSIARERQHVQAISRTKRRFPTWSTRPPSSPAGRSRLSAGTLSPSSLTPPWAISRRASLLDIPKTPAINAGR
jgi:hypothetical protein